MCTRWLPLLTVYRKPTHTGQYIAHNSNAQRSSLLSTVRALTCRADKIPSTPQARAAEHTRVRIELATKGYTMDTYKRGRYREHKATQTAPAAQETTNSTPTDDTSQAPTAHNPLHKKNASTSDTFPFHTKRESPNPWHA
jgi:hypothetical protein